MSFQLFGFDFAPSDSCFGFWFLNFKDWESEKQRNLFGLYYAGGAIYFDLFWFNILKGYE